jgi:hypothetical protein
VGISKIIAITFANMAKGPDVRTQIFGKLKLALNSSNCFNFGFQILAFSLFYLPKLRKTTLRQLGKNTKQGHS